MSRNAVVGHESHTPAAPGRTMRRRPQALAMLGLAGVLIGVGAEDVRFADAKSPPPTQPSRPGRAQFRTIVDNPYYPLVRGSTCRYVEKLGRIVSEIEIAVTDESRTVLGVACVVVREKVWEQGKLTQENLSWHAQDVLGNVWLFGEDAKEFLDRGRIDREGSWEAGVDGAEPGIVMPGRHTPGEPFRLGYAAGIAEDMAQIVAMDDSARVPFGTFGSCLKTKEWSMLESGTDKKWYATGIGLVRARSAAGEEMVLVSVTRP